MTKRLGTILQMTYSLKKQFGNRFVDIVTNQIKV